MFSSGSGPASLDRQFRQTNRAPAARESVFDSHTPVPANLVKTHAGPGVSASDSDRHAQDSEQGLSPASGRSFGRNSFVLARQGSCRDSPPTIRTGPRPLPGSRFASLRFCPAAWLTIRVRFYLAPLKGPSYVCRRLADGFMPGLPPGFLKPESWPGLNPLRRPERPLDGPPWEARCGGSSTLISTGGLTRGPSPPSLRRSSFCFHLTGAPAAHPTHCGAACAARSSLGWLCRRLLSLRSRRWPFAFRSANALRSEASRSVSRSRPCQTIFRRSGRPACVSRWPAHVRFSEAEIHSRCAGYPPAWLCFRLRV